MQVNDNISTLTTRAQRMTIADLLAGANTHLAHMVVIAEVGGSSRRVIGPFPTLTDAQAHAYWAFNDVAETDVEFVPFYSSAGSAYLPYQVASTSAILGEKVESAPEEVAPPYVVLAAPDGELRAFGPFVDAAEAENWLGDAARHPDNAVAPLEGIDGARLHWHAFTGVLDAVTRLEQVLRLSLSKSHGLVLNDMAEPECVDCEWLPLIGIYGHLCGSTFVEYPHW